MGRVLVMAGLLALTVAAHGRSVGFGFVWDDHELILKNPLVRGGRPAAHVWTTHFFEGSRPQNSGLYRPLVIASFRLGWSLWPAAWAFHLTNVTLHALCVLLALWLARRLGAGTPAAALGACLFAVFPPNIEAVAWISGRPDLLMTLGLGLALTAALHGHAWTLGRQAALLLAGLTVALLSKELALPAAGVLALWLVLPGGDTTVGSAARRRWLALAVALLLVGALVVRGLALGSLLPELAQPGDQSPGARLARLGVQLQMLSGFQLSAMARVPRDGGDRLLAQLLGVILPLVMLGGAALLWRRSARAAALLLVLALALALPAATARVPALRYLYAPAFLLCVLGALGLQRLARSWRPRLVWAMASSLLVLHLAFGQLWLGAWRSDALLFATEAAHQPKNPDAQFLYGEQLLIKGQHRETAKRFRKVLALARGHRPAWMGLARALLYSGQATEAEKVVRITLGGRPRLALQFTLLGQALASQGKHQQALGAFAEALKRQPGSAAARRGVAQSRAALKSK